MKKLKDYFQSLRPSEWYKNLLIPAVGIFSFQFFNISVYLYLFLGFLCACGISSVNYIINDLKDYEQDKLHPKKKIRPIASGTIAKKIAIIIACILLPISLICSLLVSFWFFICMLILFLLSQLYTFYLKQIIIVDVLTISINFILRGIAGLFIIISLVSTWQLPEVWSFWALFILALFLALIKRKVDLLILKRENNVNDQQIQISHYPEKLLDKFLFLISGIFLMGYYIYVLTNDAIGIYLLVTIPVATYMMFRTLFLIYNEENFLQKGKRILKDPGMVISGIIVFILFLSINYLHTYGFL